ncbi:hypothetical protein HNY73_022461 [Argiope bruennichi]|uniref:Uncharacterized protein n=1 Tax=Argiope bruennichi TaxID=94029 RepID=A0A8T0E2I4_ARGBR|nr:hypothetical protein HNY73_022461 [Argiope bruennichi]
MLVLPSRSLMGDSMLLVFFVARMVLSLEIARGSRGSSFIAAGCSRALSPPIRALSPSLGRDVLIRQFFYPLAVNHLVSHLSLLDSFSQRWRRRQRKVAEKRIKLNPLILSSVSLSPRTSNLRRSIDPPSSGVSSGVGQSSVSYSMPSWGCDKSSLVSPLISGRISSDGESLVVVYSGAVSAFRGLTGSELSKREATRGSSLSQGISQRARNSLIFITCVNQKSIDQNPVQTQFNKTLHETRPQGLNENRTWLSSKAPGCIYSIELEAEQTAREEIAELPSIANEQRQINLFAPASD